MGTTRRAIAVLVLAGMIVAAAPPALWADSAIPPGANIFGVNPNANGTKVSGQLAIYYQVISTTCGGGPLHLVNMYFVMRLKLGVDTFDCAVPTRLARHGVALVPEPGRRWRVDLLKSRWRASREPIHEGCPCPTCVEGFSRGTDIAGFCGLKEFLFGLCGCHIVLLDCVSVFFVPHQLPICDSTL